MKKAHAVHVARGLTLSGSVCLVVGLHPQAMQRLQEEPGTAHVGSIPTAAGEPSQLLVLLCCSGDDAQFEGIAQQVIRAFLAGEIAPSPEEEPPIDLLPRRRDGTARQERSLP